MKTIVVMTSDEIMEITEKEYEALFKFREKEARRQGYIDEINDLIARAKADGFTLGTISKKSCQTINEAKAWGDAEGTWIELL